MKRKIILTDDTQRKFDEICWATMANIITLSKHCDVVAIAPFNPKNREHMFVLHVAKAAAAVSGKEVGLDVNIVPKFRVSTHFSLKKGTINEAVYYCAEAKSTTTTLQKDEVEKTEWLNFEEAYNHLTYECDKKILMKFIEFFREYIG